MAGTPLWAWAAVVAVALALIALDLLLHRDPKAVTMREAGLMSAGYLAVGLAFGGVLWWTRGAGDGGEYLTGYLIEKALSLDNVFVFALILGLRALYFLLAGAIPRFRYLKAGLAGLLVLVGVKMLLTDVGKLPAWASLGAVVLVLAASIGASLIAERRERTA